MDAGRAFLPRDYNNYVPYWSFFTGSIVSAVIGCAIYEFDVNAFLLLAPISLNRTSFLAFFVISRTWEVYLSLIDSVVLME